MSRIAFRLARGAGMAVTVSGALLAFATPAHATIDQAWCHGTGFDSPVKPDSVDGAKAAAGAGATVDFASAAVWHVHSWKDYLSGVGNSDGAMSSGQAFVDAFGLSVQVAGGSGSGSTGSGGPISAYDLASKLPGPLGSEPPAAVIFASGSAAPDPNGKPPAPGPCSGQIAIVFDDASPASTAEGQLGIAMMVLGGLGAAGTALRKV